MAIDERINYFRNKRGATQKRPGQAVDFPQKAADVRVAQNAILLPDFCHGFTKSAPFAKAK